MINLQNPEYTLNKKNTFPPHLRYDMNPFTMHFANDTKKRYITDNVR